MEVERNPEVLEYKHYNCSISDYSLFAWTQIRTLKDEHTTKKTGAKKATNPPKVEETTSRIIIVPAYSDDGEYPIPSRYLGVGILSGVQHRVLVGATYGT